MTIYCTAAEHGGLIKLVRPSRLTSSGLIKHGDHKNMKYRCQMHHVRNPEKSSWSTLCLKVIMVLKSTWTDKLWFLELLRAQVSNVANFARQLFHKGDDRVAAWQAGSRGALISCIKRVGRRRLESNATDTTVMNYRRLSPRRLIPTHLKFNTRQQWSCLRFFGDSLAVEFKAELWCDKVTR